MLILIIDAIVLAINISLSLIIVFRERKNTSSTWAWIFVVNIFPIIGFLIYLLVGRGVSNRRMFNLQGENRPDYSEKLAVMKKFVDEPHLIKSITHDAGIGQVIHMLYHEEEAIVSTNTSVKLFVDGRENFDQLLEDIKQAKHHIHFEYYIFRFDNLGNEIYQELLNAARRGVMVRILIDAWGSNSTKRKDFKELRELGGHFEYFFPSLIRKINPRFNYRLHRKIVIIDGQIAYTGGFNVGDEYVTKTKKYGYWRDTNLRITGDVVYSMQDRFVMDWNSQHHHKIEDLSTGYYPKSLSHGNLVSQFVSSGPDDERQQIKLTYVKMISSAKHEIIIQTPYYIPDDTLHDTLKIALLSGVSVKLLIPNKPDHPFVYWATYFYAAQLVEYGAEVYTYEAGFIHAKTMIIDGKYSSVGSANFDNRSFDLDFEGNILLYDWDFSQKLRRDFLEDLKHSKRLTKERYEERSYFVRFREGIARLIGPLL